MGHGQIALFQSVMRIWETVEGPESSIVAGWTGKTVADWQSGSCWSEAYESTLLRQNGWMRYLGKVSCSTAAQQLQPSGHRLHHQSSRAEPHQVDFVSRDSIAVGQLCSVKGFHIRQHSLSTLPKAAVELSSVRTASVRP